VEHVFLGEEGIVSQAKPGQVLVDHSTVGPSTSRKIAAAAEAKGAWFLDAPVSGLVKGATEATLTIMVGGERSAFDTALPVFRALGSNIYHVGGPGAGSAIKLMNQMLWSINTLGAAEACLLSAKLGADPDLALEIFGNSSGQSSALTRSGPRMLNQNFAEDVLPLRLVLKDISLANEMALEAGANLTAAQDALEVFQRAADEGLAELDASSIFLTLQGLREDGQGR
jgi:3-hydroxyisobutyrate dehydrogenase-like beta-hydroxyacid dehydrogenase